MRRCAAMLMVAIGWGASGCGSGDIGADVQVSPDEMAGPLGGVAGKTLALPGERPFNIHLKSSSQNPGERGRARGDSDARTDGEAFCLAESSNGGSATAEFRLGHRIITAGGSPSRVAIQLEFDLRQSLQVSAPPTPKTLAGVSLQVLVLDAHRRVLARPPLILTTSDEGVESAAETHHRNIAITLDPNQTCDIMLYGKVDAAAAEGQDATARLDLRGLKMVLDVQPVTSQPAGTPASSESSS